MQSLVIPLFTGTAPDSTRVVTFTVKKRGHGKQTMEASIAAARAMLEIVRRVQKVGAKLARCVRTFPWCREAPSLLPTARSPPSRRCSGWSSHARLLGASADCCSAPRSRRMASTVGRGWQRSASCKRGEGGCVSARRRARRVAPCSSYRSAARRRVAPASPLHRAGEQSPTWE